MESPVHIIPATSPDVSLVQKLWTFYVYDLSRECGSIQGWQSPTDPHFVPDDITPFFQDADKHPFLIKVDDEVAGFIFTGKIEVLPDIDTYVHDFFVISKFQNRGIGKRAALGLFKQHAGKWGLGVIPENKRALTFWRNVLTEYTRGCFSECFKTAEELKTSIHPKPHPMVLFTFNNTKNDYNDI